MKRAGLYFFFDKDGSVDGYVPYFIRELHKVVDYIVVVVNGKLTADGRRALVDVADDLFVRENVGFDGWAYKDAIEYIGWDELRQYDELVITNNTIFGPIFPFQEAFDKMSAAGCDFWGLCTTYGTPDVKNWFGVPLKWGCRPDCITSNFQVYKETVLHSYEFRRFWDTLRPLNSYYDALVYMEMSITNDLVDAGFVGAALDQGMFRHAFPSPMTHGAYDLILQCRVPVIRKKAFHDPGSPVDYCSDIPRQLMKYVAEHTDYDCDLIWENLLRTVNQYDLKNWFNWNTILPLDYAPERKRGQRIAVIFHHYYSDIMGQYLHNIEAFPDGTHFYFTTDTEEKQAALEELLVPLAGRFHIEHRLVENRGRDVSALLVGCRDVVLEGGYDLICFMHDKKGIGNLSGFACEGRSFSDCCFENISPTAEYVNNVLDLFEGQPRLGIAVPPPPKNGRYYIAIGGTWGAAANYSLTEKLLTELGVSVPLDYQKPPVAPYGTVFWFRPDALLPLFGKEWVYEDFDAEPTRHDGTISTAIERAYTLIAQARGYHPMVIMNASYAEQEVTRMTEIAHSYITLTKQHVGGKALLRQAEGELAQLLRRLKNTAAPAAKQAPAPARPAPPASAPAVVQKKRRGPFKSALRGICPIGIWNLLRRAKCAAIDGVYINEDRHAPLVKKFVKAFFPRAIWNGLRRLKCAATGGVYAEDGV